MTKRARSKDSFSLLSELLFGAVEKYLRCHVLSYCYRSCNALRRTCKALHRLFLHQELWRYGVGRELALHIAAWPREVRVAFTKHFDLYFDKWPADMPDSPEMPNLASRLYWIWGKGGRAPLVRVASETASWDLHLPLAEIVAQAADGSRTMIRNIRGYSWMPSARNFYFTSCWNKVPLPPAEAGDVETPPWTEWDLVADSIGNTCMIEDAEPRNYTFFSVFIISGEQRSEVFWHKKYVHGQGILHHGYRNEFGDMPKRKK